MSRAQNRSTGTQSGAQATQRTAGSVTGSAGDVTGTGENVGATSTSLRDQPGTQTGTSYARGTATRPAARPAAGADTSTHNGIGGIFSLLAGLLTFLTGLSMVVRRHFYPTLSGYAYRWSVPGWGWLLLILGILLFAAGASHLLGIPFGRMAATALATLAAIAGFMVLAYTPVWGIVLVGVSLLAIWGLLRGDRGENESAGAGAGYGSTSGYGSGYGTGSGTGSGTGARL
jgi:hypothetical protein